MNASTSKTWTSRRRLFWSWKGSATIDTWLQTMSFLPVEIFILGHGTEVLTCRLLWCHCFKTNSKLMMVASDFFSKIWLLFWQPGTSRNPFKIFSHTGLVWLALCLESPPVKMHDQCSAGKEQPGAWWLHEFQANVTLVMVYWKFQSGLGSFLSRGEGIWLSSIFWSEVQL